jgi:MFS family permease
MTGLRALAVAVGLSAGGDMLAVITLALVVHDLTGSGLWVSAFFATTMVPVVALAPVAGALVDRRPPAAVLAAAAAAQGVLAAALAAGSDSLALVLVGSALLTAGAAFAQPAEFALVPALARDDEALARANGRLEAARYAGFALGPVLAGAVMAAGGATTALVLDAASFAVVAAVGLRLRRVAAPREAARTARPRDGLAHLWRDPVLRPTLAAAVGALAFVSASITVEVFYVEDVLHAGDAGYAATTAAWMAGMVAGALSPLHRVRAPLVAGAALLALGAQGAAIALATAWAVLPFALLAFLAGGLAHGAKNTLLRTLIATRVPRAAHGRAYAGYAAARNAAELSALAAGGLLVGALGPRTALLVAGLGPVVAALAGLAAVAGGLPRPAITARA